MVNTHEYPLTHRFLTHGSESSVGINLHGSGYSPSCLSWVTQIHTTFFSTASSHDLMQLINEKNDSRTALVSHLLNFIQNGFDAFFVFTLVFGTSHESTHI